MKDTKFIELLNLYVDQQIDPADAALLEQEISRNPARRETYREYCRMHRACGMLFEQSLPQTSVGAKLAASAAAAEKVIEFPQQRRHSPLMAAGFGLAAAGLVFAFVTLTQPSQVENSGSNIAVTPAPRVTEVVIAPVQPSPQETEKRPSSILMRENVRLAFGPQGVPDSLAWLTKVDLQPLAPFNPDVNFEMRPIQSTPVTFQSPLPLDKEVEKAAFQFRLGP